MTKKTDFYFPKYFMEALACITKEGRMDGSEEEMGRYLIQSFNAHGYITESLSLHMFNITHIC